MRSLYSAVALSTVALFAGACGRATPPARTPDVVVPESFKSAPRSDRAAFAPVVRGTIRLGEVETAGAATEAPTAVGGGPAPEAAPAAPSGPMSQTSVGSMSPTTVTGADSPLDNATTAPPAAGQPGNPTMTGSATAPAGPNSHGGVVSPAGR